jgi:hypothetical protein
MRVLDGEQMMARIFFGESDRWRHQPLSVALLSRLRGEGFAGATVFHGVGGFGARSVIHTTHVLRLSEDLPVVVEVVDTAEKMERLVEIVDEMVGDGLMTIEKVRVVRYRAGTTGGV